MNALDISLNGERRGLIMKPSKDNDNDINLNLLFTTQSMLHIVPNIMNSQVFLIRSCNSLYKMSTYPYFSSRLSPVRIVVRGVYLPAQGTGVSHLLTLTQ